MKEEGQALQKRPAPGVYVYATSGFESVDALLGSRHDYPLRTTITVEPGGCGLLLRWDALTDRSTVWNLCPLEDGWAIRDYSEVHRFFGQTERTVYRCEAGSLWLPPAPVAGASFARRCSTSNTSETTVGTVVGAETLQVGGEALETVHVALSLKLDGRTRGAGTIDLWLAASTSLVVRFWLTNDNKSSSVIGDVRYRESARLELVSLEPRR